MQPAASLATEQSALDLGVLYEEHGPFLGRVLLRMLGDGTHVDDVLQETFIIAFKKRDTFDPNRAAERTWLYGIATNLCRHHKRGTGRFRRARDRLLEESPAELAAQPDGELERKQNIEMVQAIIGSLPFKQREVFVLFEIEGLAGKEIADILQIPLGTVHTRLHEGRNQFRAKLERRLARENKQVLS